MASTNFVDGSTRIVAEWLNDIDKLNYDILGNPGSASDLRDNAGITAAIATAKSEAIASASATSAAGDTAVLDSLAATSAGSGIDLVGRGLNGRKADELGATGDGSTDDSAAVQAALNNSSVTRLYLTPEKTYRLGGITVPAGKILDCRWATIIPASASTTVFTLSKNCKIYGVYGVGTASAVGATFTGKFFEVTSLDSSFETDLTYVQARLVGDKASIGGTNGIGFHVNHNSALISQRIVGLYADLWIYGFGTGLKINVSGSGTGYVTSNVFKGAIKDSGICIDMQNSGADDFMQNFFNFHITPENGVTTYGVRLSGYCNVYDGVVWDAYLYDTQSILFDANSSGCTVITGDYTKDKILDTVLDQGSQNRIIVRNGNQQFQGDGTVAAPILIGNGIRTNVASGGGTSTVDSTLTEEDLGGDTLLVTVGPASAATADVPIGTSNGLEGYPVWDESDEVWKVVVTNNRAENLDIAWKLYRC